MREKKSIGIVAIVGPTASGKSELAVRLAKKYNGEIISADSRQAYRGLDIGSGKVRGKWLSLHYCEVASGDRGNPVKHNGIASSSDRDRSSRNDKLIFIYKNIPHHCIDYVSPKKRYTVVDFQQCANKAIADIRARGKIPFLVGGTGFYIDAVLNNAQFPSVPANKVLRKKLEHLSAKELFAMLKRKDVRRAVAIDPHNKRRLIRALEIIAVVKKPIPLVPTEYYEKLRLASRRSGSQENVVVLGIKKNKKMARNAIAKRINTMLKRGLVAETKKLHAAPPAGIGLSWKRIAEFGFEYRLPALFLQKKISRKELEEQLVKENWRYAKRQMTWWRHHADVHWVSAAREVHKLTTNFLKFT
jgi:tRNA dimethylallyltransferase